MVRGQVMPDIRRDFSASLADSPEFVLALRRGPMKTNTNDVCLLKYDDDDELCTNDAIIE